jgi:hypothetical protein
MVALKLERVEGMKIKQGRIKENNPDKAAMKIREMYNEYEGNLIIQINILLDKIGH